MNTPEQNKELNEAIERTIARRKLTGIKSDHDDVEPIIAAAQRVPELENKLSLCEQHWGKRVKKAQYRTERTRPVA